MSEPDHPYVKCLSPNQEVCTHSYCKEHAGHEPGLWVRYRFPKEYDHERSPVDLLAIALMEEWEKAEQEPVPLSKVATFADMARAGLRHIQAQVEGEIAHATMNDHLWLMDADGPGKHVPAVRVDYLRAVLGKQ